MQIPHILPVGIIGHPELHPRIIGPVLHPVHVEEVVAPKGRLEVVVVVVTVLDDLALGWQQFRPSAGMESAQVGAPSRAMELGGFVVVSG